MTKKIITIVLMITLIISTITSVVYADIQPPQTVNAGINVEQLYYQFPIILETVETTTLAHNVGHRYDKIINQTPIQNTSNPMYTINASNRTLYYNHFKWGGSVNVSSAQYENDLYTSVNGYITQLYNSIAPSTGSGSPVSDHYIVRYKFGAPQFRLAIGSSYTTTNTYFSQDYGYLYQYITYAIQAISFSGSINVLYPCHTDNNQTIELVSFPYSWSDPHILIPSINDIVEYNINLGGEYAIYIPEDEGECIVTSYSYDIRLPSTPNERIYTVDNISYPPYPVWSSTIINYDPTDLTYYINTGNPNNDTNPDTSNDYNRGYTAGYTAGFTVGSTTGYDAGYSDGYDEGLVSNNATSVTGWIGNTISGIFAIPLFTVGAISFSLGGIFSAILGIAALVVFLKIFAGG